MRIRQLMAMLTVAALFTSACGTIDDSTSGSDGWRVVFEAGTPWGPDGHGAGSYGGSWLLAGASGLLVAATGEGGEAVADLFQSTDGATWTKLDSTLDSLGIVYVDMVIAGPEGFILRGFGYPEEGHEVISVLRSSDGVAWSEVDDAVGLAALVSSFQRSDGSEHEIYGSIRSIVPYGDGYVAGGDYGGEATVWISDDGGAWQPQVVAEGGGFPSWIAGLASANDRVYAVGNAPAMTVWESADGVTWNAVAGPDAFAIEVSETEYSEDPYHASTFIGLAPYRGGLAALIQVGRRNGDAWCFVDAETCNQMTLEILTSNDGRAWQTLPLPDDSTLVNAGSLSAVDDDLVLAEASDGRLQIWTAGDLGSGSPIEAPGLPELGFDIVQWGGAIEQGVTYGYPLWTHCGIDHLGEFNGRAWGITDDSSADLPAENWNRWGDMVYGTLELVAPDRIEYTVSDTVIASYGPAAAPEDQTCM